MDCTCRVEIKGFKKKYFSPGPLFFRGCPAYPSNLKFNTSMPELYKGCAVSLLIILGIVGILLWMGLR